jgi:hypothetical protein
MYLQPKAKIRNKKTFNKCVFIKDGVAWTNNKHNPISVTRYTSFSVGAAFVTRRLSYLCDQLNNDGNVTKRGSYSASSTAVFCSQWGNVTYTTPK